MIKKKERIRMSEMYDESILNSYMIQVRMQAIAGSLRELGYASELIIENPETQELRMEAPENKGTVSAKYEITFDDEGQNVVGFILRLYRVKDDSSDAGEPMDVKIEELALDSDETAKWIVDHILLK